jgi:CRP/FNR family transcriptional regulator, cyclic AMP receptor protein
MSTTATLCESPTPPEDALAYLPITSATEYSKGQMIYGPLTLSKTLYLVVTGTVELSQIADDGSEVILDVVLPEELFGESAFIDVQGRSDRATAMENTKVMAWAISDMDALAMKRPRFALALLQLLAQRNADLTRRIESFVIDGIERRLARSLIHFAERLGSREEDGSVRMMPLTHEMLSRYIGTSREVVTQYMNRFRRQGYVNYSRLGIVLYRDALRTLLNGGGPPSASISS